LLPFASCISRSSSGIRKYLTLYPCRQAALPKAQAIYVLPLLCKYLHNTGKSYIGCALGVADCRNYFTVKYVRLPDLLDELAIAPEVKVYLKR